MGMNESAVLAEPAKSAKERLKDILLEAEKLKKEVQAEEDARQKAIAAAAATRSTLTVREFLGMLSPITATINIANERTGGVSLSHAVSQTLRRSGALWWRVAVARGFADLAPQRSALQGQVGRRL